MPNRLSTKITAVAITGTLTLGFAAPVFAVEDVPTPGVTAVTPVAAQDLIIDALDGVDYNAIVSTIDGVEELKTLFDATRASAANARAAVEAAYPSVVEAVKAANNLQGLVDAPVPTTLADVIARGKEITAASIDATNKYKAAETSVNAAYTAVMDTRTKAEASIAQAKVVRANAEAVIRDPNSNPAAKEAAMDALAVIGANLAENEDFIAAANAILAKVNEVKAAAERAQRALDQAKATAERMIAAEKAFERAAADAIERTRAAAAQATAAAEKAAAQARQTVAKARATAKQAVADARALLPRR